MKVYSNQLYEYFLLYIRQNLSIWFGLLMTKTTHKGGAMHFLHNILVSALKLWWFNLNIFVEFCSWSPEENSNLKRGI